LALYKGFASNKKLGIQIQQNPAIPKTLRICVLVVRVGIKQTACFHSALRLRWLLDMWKSQVFNLVLEDLSLLPGYFVSSLP
jgi:hypothetical protein